MADPASLQNLHDIVIPPSIPWWPPAPGWYAVAACVAMGIAWFAWLRFRQWRADAYRRSALEELARLKALIETDEREPALRKLPELLKRTAMAVWPRKKVAALTGFEWMQFLDHTGNTNEFCNGDARMLAELAYTAHGKLRMMPDDQIQQLTKIVEKWIKNHRIR